MCAAMPGPLGGKGIESDIPPPGRPAGRGRVRNIPMWVGIGCGVFLFVVFLSGWLASWTPLTGTYARDYITLPQCGFAVRFGTDMFTSSEDYAFFGPVGTRWLSHPMLCITAGVPLSYLPPMVGFMLLDCLYLVLHLGIIVAFGRRLPMPYRVRDVVVFAALGLFFPWFVMYHVGQYHAIAVMALALVLHGARWRVHGFVLSALSKPVLAPAGLVLIARGHFREVLRIVFFVVLFTLPFAVFGYTADGGLHFGGGALIEFLRIGTDQATQFVPGWDQQMSLALLIDEWFPSWPNTDVRLVLTVLVVGYALIGLRRAPLEVAIAMASLWFFVYYGRGHEYHATLLVPIFVYLWTERRGVYRTWWMALLCVLSALPTTWPIFIHILGLSGPGPDSFAVMDHESPLLFTAFLAHKPLTVLALALTIGFTEAGVQLRNRKSATPVPSEDREVPVVAEQLRDGHNRPGGDSREDAVPISRSPGLGARRTVRHPVWRGHRTARLSGDEC
jgi:hypothetical protein